MGKNKFQHFYLDDESNLNPFEEELEIVPIKMENEQIEEFKEHHCFIFNWISNISNTFRVKKENIND